MHSTQEPVLPAPTRCAAHFASTSPPFLWPDPTGSYETHSLLYHLHATVMPLLLPSLLSPLSWDLVQCSFSSFILLLAPHLRSLSPALCLPPSATLWLSLSPSLLSSSPRVCRATSWRLPLLLASLSLLLSSFLSGSCFGASRPPPPSSFLSPHPLGACLSLPSSSPLCSPHLQGQSSPLMRLRAFCRDRVNRPPPCLSSFSLLPWRQPSFPLLPGRSIVLAVFLPSPRPLGDHRPSSFFSHPLRLRRSHLPRLRRLVSSFPGFLLPRGGPVSLHGARGGRVEERSFLLVKPVLGGC